MWYVAYLRAAIVMTLIVFEGHSLLLAFSSAIFGICGGFAISNSVVEVYFLSNDFTS